jgi:hypothetical protein
MTWNFAQRLIDRGANDKWKWFANNVGSAQDSPVGKKVAIFCPILLASFLGVAFAQGPAPSPLL